MGPAATTFIRYYNSTNDSEEILAQTNEKSPSTPPPNHARPRHGGGAGTRDTAHSLRNRVALKQTKHGSPSNCSMATVYRLKTRLAVISCPRNPEVNTHSRVVAIHKR